MTFQAGGWLKQRLMNPVALRLSAGRASPGTQPAFSIAATLKAPRQLLLVPDGRSGGLFLGASQFWAIRNRYPHAGISLLVPRQREYIAREIPFVDDVIVYEDFLLPVGKKLRGVIRRLREHEFDVAFCFSSEENFCAASLCYRSGATLRIGFQREEFPFFNICIVPRSKACYEPERLALLLRTLGVPPVKERVSWSVSREGARKIRERYLVGHKPGEQFVGLDISTSTGSKPGVRQFLSIAEQAVARENSRLLLFFDYAERKTANRIREALGQRVLLFQTDDLPKIVALLEACYQLIAANTDLFHLAVAMGLPVTGIFARSDIVRWVPEDRKNVEVFEYETLKAWSAGQIADAVKQRISSTHPQKERSR